MAHQRVARTHSDHLVSELTANLRNALRHALSSETGLLNLRIALGIQNVRVIGTHEERTGHARRGSTIELFRNHRRHEAANIAPESHSLEVKHSV